MSMSEIIQLTATNAVLKAADGATMPVLTSGMQGHVKVQFTFSEAWGGLNKAAVFRVCNRSYSVLEEAWEDSNVVTIPAEVFKHSGYVLNVGVYGYSVSPDVVELPTIWCVIDEVQPGADPNAETPEQPTPQIWEQIKHDIGDLSVLETEDKENLVAAINDAYNHGGGEQVQSDWNEADKEDPAYIKNKPSIPSIEGLATEQWVSQQLVSPEQRITTIEDKIPTAATEFNELADKAWVQNQGYLSATAGSAPEGVEMQNVYKDTEGNLVTPTGSGGGGGTLDHRQLTNRDAAYQHSISAITGLQTELDSKMSKGIIFNVKDYGATGGGTVSDSSAIQSALDACNTAGGGTVYFPKGTYLLDKPVKFYSNQYLLGEIGATLLQADTMTDDKVDGNYCNLMRNYNNGTGNGTKNAISFVGDIVCSYDVTHDVVIDGLAFDGGVQETAATALLAFCHTDRITVKNCKFTNGYSSTAAGNGHDIEINSSRNVVVSSCTFYGNRRQNTNSELNQIDTFRLASGYPWGADKIDGIAQEGYHTGYNVDGTFCENISIRGCLYFGNSVNGSTVNAAIGNHDYGSNGITVSECRFFDFYIAVKPRRCTEQTVIGNLFYSCYCGVGVYSLPASKDCSVLSNQFFNCENFYNYLVGSVMPFGFGNVGDGSAVEMATDMTGANDATFPSTLAVQTYTESAIAAAIGDTAGALTSLDNTLDGLDALIGGDGA